MTTADTAPETADQLRTTVCPGCGAVLVATPDADGQHPGASASCWRLFQVTVRGLRDEAAQDLQTAALLQLARDTYDAQHLLPGGPAAAAVRLCLERDRGQDPLAAAALAARVEDAAPRSLQPPARWTTTVADLAADLDVVDLPALVSAWADATWADWAPAAPELRRAADTALTS
ncbi:DUF5946 family protein [Modestobacter sp. VKM Ac-2986]|uniref:DUF5946 family protein n=1 Tax=Modestobacter sp. VKM Ac-2986 TaxID=3004140 RepID=UPI0022AB6EA6|nr:DUF5946 family protein [Modestobacter sp. VKM Ac-2986]MCZ2830896.1 DUF5946 family protein [Modestobacter sp. VKM Ac-2986]